eukprot:TRINITY_DN13079_c0_g1_i3.p1 TRINITY_DN13079_c0_g1~~TRINITY_DN13079_c0_g1_i3.p1  ORF type:complete len:107 (+),score=8.68 TRINITY_DN13079_c0_g1_i3:98-418(+)
MSHRDDMLDEIDNDENTLVSSSRSLFDFLRETNDAITNSENLRTMIKEFTPDILHDFLQSRLRDAPSKMSIQLFPVEADTEIPKTVPPITESFGNLTATLTIIPYL